jgi:hypothetical protein
MLTRSFRRRCRDHEKRWRDFCVDKNLEEDWLERLNSLKTFTLIGICEGHHNQRAASDSKFPYIGLRLKDQLLPGIARNWEELRVAVLNEVHKLFQAGDTQFNLELKFKLRAGRGKLIYQEELALRMRSFQVKDSEEMDAETGEWFEQSVKRIEALDSVVLAWHRGDLGA